MPCGDRRRGGLDALFVYKPRKARACRGFTVGLSIKAWNGREIDPFSPDRLDGPRATLRGHHAKAPPMNRRYAFRDYEILVTAQPAAGQAGWRPEICVIAPDDRWEFVPTHHTLVANDAQYCLEIGRRCAESAIQSMDPAREIAAYQGLWH